MTAAETLNSAGYNVTLPVVKDVSLSVDGMTRGEFDFGYGAVNAYMKAIEKGAPIKIISEAIGNEWQFYSAAAINSCADLDGKKLAISSEGGVSTALTKAWMAQECPNAKPTFLVISNSADRQLALLSGQVDASPLQIQDGLALQAKGGDKFHQLADFRKLLPDVTTTVLTVNDDWAKQNPGSVQALLKANLESVRKIIDDPSYMQSQVDHLKNDLSATYDPSVVEAYRSQWDANGGITQDGFQKTVDFFTNSGAIDPGLTVDKALDLSYLNAVLDEIGRR
jgi:NitT/TauT family transport system substrate-binding protein